jgi:hypothetical protein
MGSTGDKAPARLAHGLDDPVAAGELTMLQAMNRPPRRMRSPLTRTIPLASIRMSWPREPVHRRCFAGG